MSEPEDSLLPAEDQDSGLCEVPAVELLTCWRCRKEFIAAGRCPFCQAVMQTLPPLPVQENIALHDKLLLRLFLAYGLLLLFGVAYGAVLSAMPDRSTSELLVTTLIFDGVLSLIAVISWFSSRKLTGPRPAGAWKVWLCAPLLLAAALALNLTYHFILEEKLHLTVHDVDPYEYGSWWVGVFVICVQPAIFEELFFRGAAWNVLRTTLDWPTTLLVTSIMFGVAHIYAALSIPSLIVVGMALGLARYGSGGLLLPMLLHFLHNLAIVFYDGEWVWNRLH